MKQQNPQRFNHHIEHEGNWFEVRGKFTMSWVFGVLSKNPELHRLAGSIPFKTPLLHRTLTPSLTLHAGGLSETCLFGSNESGNNGWAVVGIGIEFLGSHTAFISGQQWETLLANPRPDLSKLDGHFMALRWTEESVECYTDRLGLRDLYFEKLADGIIFSTRLDWLCSVAPSHQLDFTALARDGWRSISFPTVHP